MADDPSQQNPDQTSEPTPPSPAAKAGPPQGGGAIELSASITPEGNIVGTVPSPGGGALRTGDATLAPGALGANDGSGIFASLQGIPIDFLIATPLISTARANMALATVMAEFINEIGFDPKDKGKARIVSFKLTRMVQDPVTQKFSEQTITVNAPLLGLVPIPALLVQSVNIDLTINVSSSLQTVDTSKADASLTLGATWGWGNASFTGSYSTSSTNTRTTDNSAKYEVQVVAQQQPLPEGMSRLMDVMASCITPIPAAAK